MKLSSDDSLTFNFTPVCVSLLFLVITVIASVPVAVTFLVGTLVYVVILRHRQEGQGG